MDFWDVAKLMWLRWYVTVPMLLLTAALTLWTAVNVSPDYQVTGHIAMVGSNVEPPEAEDGTVQIINPWSSEALAEAAEIRLGGMALADELASAGYEGSWSLGVTGRQPWLRLEVVAKSPEQAQATAARLREIIEEEIRNRQNDYNVPQQQQVSTVWFDQGETQEMITRAMRRAVVAAVGAGMIATVGVVIAFDAIARRRRMRTLRMPAPAAAAVPPPRARYTFLTELPADMGTPVAGAMPPAMPTAGHPAGSSAGPSAGQSGAPHIRARNNGVPAGRVAVDSEITTALALGEHAGAPHPPVVSATPSAPVVTTPAELTEDPTIVLPLSNRPRSGPRTPDTHGDEEPGRAG